MHMTERIFNALHTQHFDPSFVHWRLIEENGTSSKRLEYLNIFPSFFKKFNTSCTKKYFNSICVLFFLIIW